VVWDLHDFVIVTRCFFVRCAGMAMAHLAATYSTLGRHDDALAMNEKVLEFMRRVLPENHPSIGEGDVWYGICILLIVTVLTGMALYNISCSYKQAGDMPRAMECAREALRIWQAALPPGHEYVVAAEKLDLRLESSTQCALQ